MKSSPRSQAWALGERRLDPAKLHGRGHVRLQESKILLTLNLKAVVLPFFASLMDSHAFHSPVAVPLQILRLHEVRRLAAHSVQMLLLRGFGYETAYLRGL